MRPLSRTKQRKKISLLWSVFSFFTISVAGVSLSAFLSSLSFMLPQGLHAAVVSLGKVLINIVEDSQDLSLHLFKVQIFHGVFIKFIFKACFHVSNIFWKLAQVFMQKWGMINLVNCRGVCVCMFVHIHGYVFGCGVPVSRCQLCLNDRKSLQMWALCWEEKSFFCEA